MKRKVDINCFLHFTIILLISMAIIVITIRRNPDSDMWWLASTGRYIVEYKAVPKINPFVIHQDFQIIVQQWMAAIVNYLLYENFGRIGLISFSLVVLILTSIAFYSYIRLFTQNENLRFIYLYLAELFFLPYINTRPSLVTIFILLIELNILERYRRSQNDRLLIYLVLLSLWEINYHASFWPFLFVLILPYIIPQVEEISRRTLKSYLVRIWKVLAIILLMLAVGFLNPNGLKNMLYLFYSYREAEGFGVIQELMRVNIISFSGMGVLISCITCAFYIQKHKKNIDLCHLCLAVGMIILATMHLRNQYFLILGCIPILCDVWNENIDKLWRQKTSLFIAIFIVILFVTMVVGFVYIILFQNLYKETRVLDTSYTPVEAADYLDKKEDVVLYTTFNAGGYLEWRGNKVYIDARPELFSDTINQKEDVLEEYKEVYIGTINFDKFIEKYKFTHLIVDSSSILDIYLRYSNEYIPKIETKEYILYEKKDI